MTRPLDQSDVDAVLNRRYSEANLANVDAIEMHALCTDALSWLNAAVALGWSPPPAPGTVTLSVRVTGLTGEGDWRDHPLIEGVFEAAHDIESKYDGVTVDCDAVRTKGES